MAPQGSAANLQQSSANEDAEEPITNAVPLPRIERVFPIRIQVSSRQIAAPREWWISLNQYLFLLITHSATDKSSGSSQSGPQPSVTENEASTTKPELKDGRLANDGPPMISTIRAGQTSEQQGDYYVTSRFGYFSGGPDTNDPLAASDGEQVYRCEDEPIHIPGAIQRFGALIAIREGPDGIFLVRLVSENSESITGLKPQALFELRCFTDILITSDKKEFITRARDICTWTLEDDSRTNPGVFTISLTSLLGAPRPLFCAIHFNEGSDLIICEFEPKNDVFQTHEPVFPNEPVGATDNKVSEKELSKRGLKNKPLRLNRETGRQLGSMELFHILCEVQAQMARATSLPQLLDITVGLVHELTGFHRVMQVHFLDLPRFIQ
jgi:hypothetical protein